MKILNVPFYANTPDDTHCFQAALRSVLGYFQPDTSFTWEELDVLTGKKPGMWTWAMTGLLWLQEQGYTVKNIEEFDYEDFAARGKVYLAEAYGADIAEQQAAHAVLADEQKTAREFTKRIHHENRLPTFEEAQQLIDQNFVLIANVNSRALNNRAGFVGHYAVIIGYDDADLILHDPGLPPMERRRVSREQFLLGWDSPDEHRRNIMAIGSN